MEKIFGDFGLNPFLLAAQIVNFLVLLILLKRLLYKPILKMLEERKQKIADSLENAEMIEKKLQEITEKQEQEILKATKEGEKIIKQAKEYGVEIINDSKSKAEAVAERMVVEAKNQIQAEKEKLHQEMREHLGDLVALALTKLTGKVLTQRDQKQIIERSIKEI